MTLLRTIDYRIPGTLQKIKKKIDILVGFLIFPGKNYDFNFKYIFYGYTIMGFQESHC